jgi:hypothetical protein
MARFGVGSVQVVTMGQRAKGAKTADAGRWKEALEWLLYDVVVDRVDLFAWYGSVEAANRTASQIQWLE